MPNAAYSVSIPTGGNVATIFKAAVVGGTDRNGCLGFSIYNGDTDASHTLLVQSPEFHDDDEWMPLPAGKSLTLEAVGEILEIREVRVKALGAGVDEVGWGVTKRGPGSASR